MKEFIIKNNDQDQRVDKFILKAFPSLQKSVMYKAIRTKNIKLNGKRCDISTRLKEGDVLRLFISDDLLGTQKKEKKRNFSGGRGLARNEIIYEDENVTVVNKAQGIVTHPAAGNWDGTLVNALLYHWGREAVPQQKNQNSAKNQADPHGKGAHPPGMYRR